MGYTKHNSIIVTGWNEIRVTQAREKALEIFPNVSELITVSLNGWYAFFIPTDGSKEGWPESDTGDVQRKEFMDWISEEFYCDGRNYLSVIDVSHDEEGNGKIDRII